MPLRHVFALMPAFSLMLLIAAAAADYFLQLRRRLSIFFASPHVTHTAFVLIIFAASLISLRCRAISPAAAFAMLMLSRHYAAVSCRH